MIIIPQSMAYATLANLDPVYPYTPGPYYYGVAQGSGNLGPGSGHNTIPSNCTSYTGSTTSLIQTTGTVERKSIQVLDLLAREVKIEKNIPLFYIYDDGTVEKKIILE